jgi:hypothetical protein
MVIVSTFQIELWKHDHSSKRNYGKTLSLRFQNMILFYVQSLGWSFIHKRPTIYEFSSIFIIIGEILGWVGE